MCGIFCSIWQTTKNNNENIEDYLKCRCMIERRGPDYSLEVTENLSENLSDRWKGFFAASVLWMQGPQLFEQPCKDEDGNILLWNGDIFSGPLASNEIADTKILQDALRASKNITKVLKTIKGPYSIIYYQACKRKLYFARDPIGRHSLLCGRNQRYDGITLSSVGNSQLDGFFQIPAIGIFLFDLDSSELMVHPWRIIDQRSMDLIETLESQLEIKISILDPIYSEKLDLKVNDPDFQGINIVDQIVLSTVGSTENLNSEIERQNQSIMQSKILHKLMKRLSQVPDIRERIERVLQLLKKSVKLRVEKKSSYCQNCVKKYLTGETIICKHSKIAVLFSGGLDSTILASLADKYVPEDESIDLVNVAFEKARKSTPTNKAQSATNFEVPDRKTGRKALMELQRISPDRKWNFIECDVTQEELQKYRSTKIRDLVYPLSTVLDDSLGCALWFASRASGTLLPTGEQYESPSRVLLLGMGADELFGGYMRHRTILRRSGWSGLRNELEFELARISERNLGRDDRVSADHGRQPRLPYLDEDFVEYVSVLNPWERCNPTELMPPGLGDKLLLRLLAHHIGLYETANFPKRAFQFGSRIANSKENAAEISKWL